MLSRKRLICLWLGIIGVLIVGAGTASARTGMRVSLTPRTVHPGGAVSLRVRSAQRRCRLTITDRGQVIFRVVIRRGRTVIPFSANSVAARLMVHVRCGRHTINRRLRVAVVPLAPAPQTPAPPVTTPPVTTTLPVVPHPIPPPVTGPPPPATPADPGDGDAPADPGTGGPPRTGDGSPGSGSGSGSGSRTTPSGAAAEPTAAETAAVGWAGKYLGQPSWPGVSLDFTYLAYGLGSGIDLRQHTSGVTYTFQTTAQSVWGHTVGGTTGTGASGPTAPPLGALVFFDAKSGYSPQQYSLAAIMGAGGQMITTADGLNAKTVHAETLAQAIAANAHSAYVGWWLPDGTAAHTTSDSASHRRIRGRHLRAPR